MILVNKRSYHHIVVASAREATVIFNAIDYGESFDIAVQSLCLALGIPYVSASSYAYTAPGPDLFVELEMEGEL